MSGLEESMEDIIRRVVREELERAAATRGPSAGLDDRQLLYSVADIAQRRGCLPSTSGTTSAPAT